jgi:hypothetical protein
MDNCAQLNWPVSAAGVRTQFAALGISWGRKRPPSSARPLRTTVSNESYQNYSMLAVTRGYKKMRKKKKPYTAVATSRREVQLRLVVSFAGISSHGV